MDDLQRQLLTFLLQYDTSFGTLWWVANRLWAENPNFVVKQGEENNRHPGVSLKEEKPENNMIVPMLLGKSKASPTYKAVALKMDDTKDKYGYFGTLCPMDFTFLSFFNNDILLNKKKKLSSADQEKLRDFIKRRLSW